MGVTCTFATGTNDINVDAGYMYTLTRLTMLELCIFRENSGCARIQLLFIAFQLLLKHSISAKQVGVGEGPRLGGW